MKRKVKMNERQFRSFVNETVKRVINEMSIEGGDAGNVHKCSIVINGTPIIVETGHTIDEFKSQYGEGNRWDVSIEDLFSGAIEPTEGSTYWLINNRLYELEETQTWITE